MSGPHDTDDNHTNGASDFSASRAVLEAVAETTESDEAALPVLFEVVDPEALDQLFRGRGDGTVTFEYAGFDVHIGPGSTVSVRTKDE